MATRPEPTVPEPCRAYAQDSLEEDSESIPSPSLRDLAIKLFNSEEPLWGSIYNLSEKELDTLDSYLEV